MKITLKEIAIKDLFAGFKDSAEEGVLGYGGKLNIRPAYQREFVYKDQQRNAVIQTIQKDFPLNVMYWVKNQDDTYEVLDGQQRAISICKYLSGKFSLDFKYFKNLTETEREQILEYKLMVYFCEGNDKEKLDWFRTINIAGEKLFDQELRNAIYTGEWLTDAKRFFSKTNCPASNIAAKYLVGSPIRQDYLETALSWINNGEIESYMASHQDDPNANELRLYFKRVIDWVEITFPKERAEMKGVNWGALFNAYGQGALNPRALEEKISRLMQDEDVTNKKGIYTYVLSGQEKHLSIRAFTPNQKREAYERQNGICCKCGNHFELAGMEADHITPWSKGGKTSAENCQMLCKEDNRLKSNK